MNADICDHFFLLSCVRDHINKSLILWFSAYNTNILCIKNCERTTQVSTEVLQLFLFINFSSTCYCCFSSLPRDVEKSLISLY